MESYSWSYANEAGEEEIITSDVLVLGGGLAGCYAAIAAARKGQSVTVVEKGATERSGSAGTGFDHWESACTNPCSKVTPEEIAAERAANKIVESISESVKRIDDGNLMEAIPVDGEKEPAGRDGLLIAVCGACALLVLGMALSMGMILRGRRRRKRRLRRKR